MDAGVARLINAFVVGVHQVVLDVKSALLFHLSEVGRGSSRPHLRVIFVVNEPFYHKNADNSDILDEES